MELLGFDVRAGGAIGVVVDRTGNVLRSARRDGSPREAMRALHADLSGSAGDALVGLSMDPEAGELPLGDASDPRIPPVCRCSPGAAAVAAEAWVGAARGVRHAVCLWIGERVFAGTLVNGEPWMGAHGHAGAAAWLALNPVERQDYRKYGSLAAEISDRGIARRLAWRIQAGDQSAVLDRAGSLEAITAVHVYEGARAGDGVAISVVRDTARYLGMAVANLVAVVDPEVIVLGGAMASAGDLLLEPARQECLRRLPTHIASTLRLTVSPLADDGVAIGAAALALAAGQP